jgi:2-oxo-4-hydroxy-4-carboxy-5-ureidoimidazoline decarboxylase
MTIAELDGGDEAYLTPRLLECCGSTNWVSHMLSSRPFRTPASLRTAATDIWWHLQPEDWLEAFSKHPKIGATGKVSQWSAQEQSGMNSAAAETAEKLSTLNQIYFDKFGWIFVVCATGKSAAEMLSLLEERLSNRPEAELRIAAAEQDKITLLRLAKLLSA